MIMYKIYYMYNANARKFTNQAKFIIYSNDKSIKIIKCFVNNKEHTYMQFIDIKT